MRYNHRYHQLAHGSKRHRRLNLASLLLLLLAIVVLIIPARISLDSHKLLGGFVLSLWRVTLGYLISLALAFVLALAATTSPKIEAALLPILDVLQSFPTFALLPIVVYYFGANTASVVTILVVAMVWPIVFALISGINEQHRDQYEAAKIFGARGWKFLLYYRLPMLRPNLMTGSIISWGQAWDTIVGAEIIAGVAGAGHYLGTLGQAGDSKRLILGIAIYLFLIFCINQIIWLPLLHRYSAQVDV